MASCSQVPMLLSSSSGSSNKKNRWGSKSIGGGSSKIKCSAKIPMPPLNPNDPFLSRLASAAAANPDLKPKPNPDLLPYSDIFIEMPKLMASPAHVERSYNYRKHRSRRPPPDLPSILLDGRIVFIGMPLVSAVMELVIAQLFYLEWEDPKAPIYLYINSSGTTRDDGETVAHEGNGFAIYDVLMHIKNEIYTLCLGQASGQACLLLAAGKKGKRFMFPLARAMFQTPRVPPTGELAAIDVIIRAKEAAWNRDLFVKLLAKHTRNSEETVANLMKKGSFHMDAKEAIAFGVSDKILLPEKQQLLMSDVPSPEDWDKRAGVKNIDRM